MKNVQLNLPLRAALLAGACVLGTASLRAAIPALETFSYTAGQNIISSTAPLANGGEGWTDRWSGSGAATVVASATTISKTVGGFTYGSDGSMAISGGNTISAAKRPFASSALTDGADVYVSFLVQYTGGTGVVPTGRLVSVGLLDSATDASNTVDNFILLNLSGGQLGARVNNTTASVSAATFQFSYGDAALVVGRFSGWNGSAYTSTTVWINPTAADFGNTSISSTATSTTGSDGARGLAFRTNNLGANTVLFDDLRVGASWGSVVLTAVPEPSASAVVAGLAALGFVARRRRCRR